MKTVNIIDNFFVLTISEMIMYLLISSFFYILYYIIYKKSLASAKIQKKTISNKCIKKEIYHSLKSSIIITFLVFAIINSPISVYTKFYNNLSDHSILWLIVSIPAGLLMHDTYFYWMHRLLHHKKLFRRAHIVHHQSINPTPFSSYSFHYIEAIAEGLIIPLLLFIIPLHPIAIYSFVILSFIINVYGHLGYEIAPKWFRFSFLFNVLNTSTYHNLHHSSGQGNYGLYFRFWDKILGTANTEYVRLYDEIQVRRFITNNQEYSQKTSLVRNKKLPQYIQMALQKEYYQNTPTLSEFISDLEKLLPTTSIPKDKLDNIRHYLATEEKDYHSFQSLMDILFSIQCITENEDLILLRNQLKF